MFSLWEEVGGLVYFGRLEVYLVDISFMSFFLALLICFCRFLIIVFFCKIKVKLLIKDVVEGFYIVFRGGESVVLEDFGLIFRFFAYYWGF